MLSRIPTCLVMAGGRGERFGNPCKFLEEVCGEGILPRLLRQLGELCRWVIIALSPHTLNCARGFCKELPCLVLPGLGYVEDLSIVLPALRKPALVAAADLVASSQSLQYFIKRSLEVAGRGVSVVTAVRVRLRVEEPVGLSMFFEEGGPWENVKFTAGLGDVDTREDLKSLRRSCSQGISVVNVHVLDSPAPIPNTTP